MSRRLDRPVKANRLAFDTASPVYTRRPRKGLNAVIVSERAVRLHPQRFSIPRTVNNKSIYGISHITANGNAAGRQLQPACVPGPPISWRSAAYQPVPSCRSQWPESKSSLYGGQPCPTDMLHIANAIGAITRAQKTHCARSKDLLRPRETRPYPQRRPIVDLVLQQPLVPVISLQNASLQSIPTDLVRQAGRQAVQSRNFTVGQRRGTQSCQILLASMLRHLFHPEPYTVHLVAMWRKVGQKAEQGAAGENEPF
ncbi:hypothetical protein GGX14DRAFT_397606 [Mycena pura]|uniref:Uncharacterized protein n=1 Tax=Mycena pura TaxID=153505 RepID=A0AAD6YEG4_9AGAR|nr:hypothetical protein GGX14DRAFT_397606 [Mycena pura]